MVLTETLLLLKWRQHWVIISLLAFQKINKPDKLG
jgi:hypothetical protein